MGQRNFPESHKQSPSANVTDIVHLILALCLALSGLCHYLLFGQDKQAFAFRMRSHPSVLAVDAVSGQLGKKTPLVGGQVSGVTTASEPQCDVLPDRRKATPYYQNSNTDSLFLCLHSPLASNQNCNHISQLAGSLAENVYWRLHKLLHGRRRLVVRLRLY